VRAAYNSAQRLGDRRHMLQWLSDYYDNLRRGDLTRPRIAEYTDGAK